MNIRKIKRAMDLYNNTIMYSQFGEDLTILHEFGDKYKGFYVDVGAYHPRKFSNTKLLYDKGWKGMNIEPVTEFYNLFRYERPTDININCGIGLNKGTGYINLDGAMSSYTRKEHHQGTQFTEITTLEAVFDEYLEQKQKVDLLDIDCEGMELIALKSNNWEKYRPELVMVEHIHTNEALINEYMEQNEYRTLYKLKLNTIYEDYK